MDLVGYHLALGATERHVRSARPEAPVRKPVPGGGPGRLRRGTATMLRQVADRLAPTQQARPAATTQPCPS